MWRFYQKVFQDVHMAIKVVKQNIKMFAICEYYKMKSLLLFLNNSSELVCWNLLCHICYSYFQLFYGFWLTSKNFIRRFFKIYRCEERILKNVFLKFLPFEDTYLCLFVYIIHNALELVYSNQPIIAVLIVRFNGCCMICVDFNISS